MDFVLDNLPKIVNSLGLGCDIIGAVLIWHFGLPLDISRTGAQHLITEQVDETEVKTAKRFDRWSTVGFALLFFGFLLQLASNWLTVSAK